jgi:hypothetical protein
VRWTKNLNYKKLNLSFSLSQKPNAICPATDHSTFFSKKDFWEYITNLHRLLPLARNGLKSVSGLPRAATSLGRGRAWLRYALVEQRLAQYIKVSAGFTEK